LVRCNNITIGARPSKNHVAAESDDECVSSILVGFANTPYPPLLHRARAVYVRRVNDAAAVVLVHVSSGGGVAVGDGDHRGRRSERD
jgi:hypothetical protein